MLTRLPQTPNPIGQGVTRSPDLIDVGVFQALGLQSQFFGRHRVELRSRCLKGGVKRGLLRGGGGRHAKKPKEGYDVLSIEQNDQSA